MSKGSATKRLAIGAIIAGAVGYIAGILTAPKSGKETRTEIRSEVSKRLNEAERELKKLISELTSFIDDAKAKSENLSGSAQKDFMQLVEKAGEAKEKARKVISAVHEGDAGDKDLQKAIKDANAAIEHLRDFLKK